MSPGLDLADIDFKLKDLIKLGLRNYLAKEKQFRKAMHFTKLPQLADKFRLVDWCDDSIKYLIFVQYSVLFRQDLVQELDSELSFSFSKTVLALMKQPEIYIIECIHQAISVRTWINLLHAIYQFAAPA